MSMREFHYCAMSQLKNGSLQYSHGVCAIDTSNKDRWYLEFLDWLADFIKVERGTVVVMSLTCMEPS